jgi:hypothetical protein
MNLSPTKWTAIGPAPVDTPNVSLGFSAGRIEAAAPDPGNIDTMYVGASGGGVWKTGVWNNPSPVWLVTSDEQPSINFGGYHPLVVHPAHNETVFGVVSGPGAGVLKSTNFGLSWQLLGNNTFEGAGLGSIAVHPTDVNTLYVSVWSGGNFCVAGVYKSTDGGASWNNTTTFHDGFVSDVIIARYDPQMLLAGMIPGYNGAGTGTSGVYNSPDGGMTWHLNSGNGLPTNLFVGGAIRLESASQGGHAYAVLFYNDINSGQNHQTVSGGRGPSICSSCAEREGDQTTRTCPRNILGPLRKSWHPSGATTELPIPRDHPYNCLPLIHIEAFERNLLPQCGRRYTSFKTGEQK